VCGTKSSKQDARLIERALKKELAQIVEFPIDIRFRLGQLLLDEE
jgi:hypothetical protein